MWNAGQAELSEPLLKGKQRLASSWHAPVVKLVILTHSTMKRSRRPSSSDDSDNGSNSTCWSQHSSQARRGARQKPSEVFRTDLITAMKVPDSYQLNPEDYYILADPWRQEWEKGVQVPVSPQSIPQPMARALAEKGKEVMFVRPKKLIRTSGAQVLGYVDIRTLAEGMCRYDLNEEDVAWLQVANQEFVKLALPPLDEMAMERAMEELERRCHESMTHATETEEGLGIEYDEDVVCDVCQSPDGEDNNEMVFCDKCNICVHQACYGIQKVPKGSWLCRICALGITPKCQLCPKKGGAMKPTRSGTKWVHVSCALWIPEVSIGNPEKMEPITNVSHIPSNRWALVCCLCKDKTGACIQCSAKNCRVAFHVTCGLHAGLEMKTLLTEDDEVKFKSFCPKHSGLEGVESRDPNSEDEGGAEDVGGTKGKQRGRVREDKDATLHPAFHRDPQQLSGREQDKRVNLRKLKLQQMEEDFYQFVDAQEVGSHLKMVPETADFLYQYWKLKRKANFNQPLLTPKKDEEESLARREHEVLLRRLQLFTHLRQDLERVRNLTYMVTRREKMKRSLWRVQEQIFQHQVRLIDHELLSASTSVLDLQLSRHRLSSQDSQIPCSRSRPKTKRRPKPEKGKCGDRKAVSDSLPAASKGEAPGRTLDSKSLRVKDMTPAEAASSPNSDLDLQRLRFFKQEVAQESVALKMHRMEGKKGVALEQEMLSRRRRESAQEYEEKRKKKKKNKRSEATETSGHTKNKLGSKQLDKTVSIRLVDIRSSDSDVNFVDGVTRKSSAPSDVPTHSKLKANVASEGVPVDISRVSNGPGGGHSKGWGKFRIPKKSDKLPVMKERTPLAQQDKPLLRPLTNTPPPSQPRTRHRTGTENDGETEPCLKRCHSHQLRGDSSLSHRYGSDIIRRGVLAS
ncbi:protein Jade-1 isoform X2 [Nerophis ophidion]|uniref:protein Jade-1 isoform X2 n=1 Tax=Nerophis ophidion TaxID=159077 RepID=UPI002ADF7B28|nr:protein Jade-1 isoform X2 [Nerophis ophidion]